MIESGHFFFRWRGIIPLLFTIPLILALNESADIESIIGDTYEDVLVLISFIIALTGLGIRALTVGYVPGSTSGRNTTEQRAEFLNTDGMYSIVRNPLYLGNFIIILGVMMSIGVWWLCLIISLIFFIYMERIILTEEAFLEKEFGETYKQWRSKTPVILPNLKLWTSATVEFSWKTVLKREYPGFLAIGTAFIVTEMARDIMFEHQTFQAWIREDILWPIIYAIIVVIALTLRTLKKHTNVLKVEGR
jgi:protein-S-isoprenylcysteine O-methyltransferase Ste14